MKKKVNVWDYAGKIVEAMRPGILVTTKANDQVNTMTIGWGTLGIEWNRPIFILYVRESRYTMQMLVWAGDDEFPPSAQVLYSDNFEEGFAPEDRVVAGDILISTIKANM